MMFDNLDVSYKCEPPESLYDNNNEYMVPNINQR